MGNVIETVTGTTTYNVLNDVTATPFSVSFSQLPTVKKNTKNGAAVMSLKTFIRSSAFRSTITTMPGRPHAYMYCSMYTMGQNVF
jgi:hypothetical protein